jgi:hypothetical protein
MTYEESAALMKDQVFHGRVKVAGLKYTTYILSEDPATPAHNSRYKWAQNFALQPDMIASQIQPMVVMDAQVQTDGAAISDAALQTSVEFVVNKII